MQLALMNLQRILLLVTTCCCALLQLHIALPVSAGRPSSSLKYGFYKRSCPKAESIVRRLVAAAVTKEARMAASLLRLHFHDCFVQGCDASLLLKSIPGVLDGEQEARANIDSVRGFDVVDDIKAALEKECPGVVSCADLLAIAARDSVLLSGGPFYRVPFGRRDSFSASRLLADRSLPSFNSSVADLVASFARVGLSASDMVVLSGGHTIGKAACPTFASRIPPASDDPSALAPCYADSLSRQCSARAPALVNLDAASSTLFDNRFYSNLLKSRGLLHSDQVLYSTPGATRDLVARYAADQASFFSDFAAAMVKMGSIEPLTGDGQGQVRTQCGFVNNNRGYDVRYNY